MRYANWEVLSDLPPRTGLGGRFGFSGQQRKYRNTQIIDASIIESYRVQAKRTKEFGRLGAMLTSTGGSRCAASPNLLSSSAHLSRPCVTCRSWPANSLYSLALKSVKSQGLNLTLLSRKLGDRRSSS